MACLYVISTSRSYFGTTFCGDHIVGTTFGRDQFVGTTFGRDHIVDTALVEITLLALLFVEII